MKNDCLLYKLSPLVSVCLLGGVLLGAITEKDWFSSASTKKSIEVLLKEVKKESFLNVDTCEVWPKPKFVEPEDSLKTKEEEE